MTISNYNNLVLNLENYSKRTDASIAIPTFIALAENKIDQHLDLRNNETLDYATLNTDDRFINYPTRYHKLRSLQIVDGDCRIALRYKVPQELLPKSQKGLPTFYTLTNKIHFDVIPDKNYSLEMVYLMKLLPLSEERQTNPVITEYPNLYLYACLEQLYRWAQDYASAAEYKQLFLEEVTMVNNTERRERYGSGIAMSVYGSTP